jgi:NADH-quinone oxidoreductase subunit L
MLYTFHGSNRTGTAEQSHLREAPWIMTGPLVALGALSIAGGWLNLPHFFALGPTERLEHWLEPVVGEPAAHIAAGAATPPVGVELALVGIAVAVALAGIMVAVTRLKPAAVRSASETPEPAGIARVVAAKYYVDEIYDRMLVRPLVALSRSALWRGMDVGLIDGLLVNGSAYLMRGLGWIGARLQTGQVGTYAWVLVIGVIAVLGAFTIR